MSWSNSLSFQSVFTVSIQFLFPIWYRIRTRMVDSSSSDIIQPATTCSESWGPENICAGCWTAHRVMANALHGANAASLTAAESNLSYSTHPALSKFSCLTLQHTVRLTQILLLACSMGLEWDAFLLFWTNQRIYLPSTGSCNQHNQES